VSDDIVGLLRNWHTKWDWYLPDEAAAEIERLRVERDRWREVADELYWSGNCSETCVDGSGGCDCSCSWGGAQWEYEQAVRGD
jgi:hypothetical protein